MINKNGNFTVTYISKPIFPLHDFLFSMTILYRMRYLLSLALILSLPACGSETGTSPPDTSDNAVAPTEQPEQTQDDDNKTEEAIPEQRKSDIRFEMISNETSRINHQYQNGQQSGHFTMLETLGGGVAMLDYDNDGDMDLAFALGGRFSGDEDSVAEISSNGIKLYRNDGQLKFTDVTKQSGLANSVAFYNHGMFAQDYDSDGNIDLLVTGYGGIAVLHNDGGTFTNVTSTLGLNDPSWSVGAAWGDIDGDGTLELYVGHYVDWSFANNPRCSTANDRFLDRATSSQAPEREVCSPREFNGLADRIYKFDDNGQLVDISKQVGLRDDGKGLAVMLADVDLDGDLDVYVANDTTPNFFYKNDGSGSFNESATVCGVGFDNSGKADGSMGIDLGDYNLDGLPDLFVSNFQNEQFALYRNLGQGMFQHVSSSTGMLTLSSGYVGWGTVFLDADRDGDEDIFVANGHVQRSPLNATVSQMPVAMENVDGRFHQVNQSVGLYFTTQHEGRGIAMGDLNNDGMVDMVISHVNDAPAILINRTENNNKTLVIQLRGVASNRAAVGARITVTSENSTWQRQIKGGTSFASTHDPRVFFGIPENDVVKQVTVHWPSGITQVVDSVDLEKPLTLTEPKTE